MQKTFFIECFAIDYTKNTSYPVTLEYISEYKGFYELKNGTNVFINTDIPYFFNQKPKDIIYSLKQKTIWT